MHDKKIAKSMSGKKGTTAIFAQPKNKK